jgi:uncharacterized membrane protein
MRPLQRHAPVALAGLFAVSGVLHLVRPEIYAAIVPDPLPEPLAVVRISGLLELICAAGLLTRMPWAAPASVLLLVAIFPANVQHAIDVTSDPASSTWATAAVLGRLPLQLPLIWAALQTNRREALD